MFWSSSDRLEMKIVYMKPRNDIVKGERMKLITSIFLVSSTLCFGMEEDSASWQTNRVPPCTLDQSEAAASLKVDSLHNQRSMNYGPEVPSPAKSFFNDNDLNEEVSDFLVLLPEVPDTPDIEDIQFLEDPEEIAKHCYSLANHYNDSERMVQRKIELFAIKNLELQEQLAHRVYRLNEALSDIMSRIERLDTVSKEFQATYETQKKASICIKSPTSKAHSLRNNKAKHEMSMQNLSQKITDIGREIEGFRKKKEELELELKKLGVYSVTLNQSLIRLRQEFKTRISRVAALDSLEVVAEYNARQEKPGCIVQ